MPFRAGYDTLPNNSLLTDVKRVGRPTTVEQHVDSLVERLATPDARARRGAVQALGGLGCGRGGTAVFKGADRAAPANLSAIAERLGDRDADTRSQTAYALVQRGFPHAPQAMELAKRLTTSDKRQTPGIVKALSQMGEPGAAALAGSLIHANTLTRRLVIEALGDMGTLASPHAGALAKYVGDPDPWVRTYVAESLTQIGTPFSPRIDELMTALEDDTDDIGAGVSCRGQAATRRRALQVLGQRGIHAAPHAKIVANYLEDNDVGVRRRAAEALARISVSGDAEAVKPHSAAISRCLRSKNNFLRTSAAEALMQMGPAAASSASDLKESLKDSDADVRRKAAEALGRIGPAAKNYVGNLADMLRDSDAGCRRCAAEAILQMGAAATPYAHDLAGLLDDTAAGMRWSIIEGLQGMGSAGAIALASRLGDDCSLTREMCRSTLEEMGTDGRMALMQTDYEKGWEQRKAAMLGNTEFTDMASSSTGRSAEPAHLRMKAGAPRKMLGPGSGLSLSAR